MINVFQDAALTQAAGQLTPKRFLIPLKGGSKSSSLWIGDPYTATTTATVNPGDTVINLDQTAEFLSSGSVVINGQTIAYTGTTAGTLTGVSGVVSTINTGSIAVPAKMYIGSGNLTVFPFGSDLTRGVQVSLKLTTDPVFGFPGTPAIFPVSSLGMGAANALQFNLQVAIPAGIQREFTAWEIDLSTVYARDINDPSGPQAAEAGIPIRGFGYIFQRDQGLPNNLRLFPTSRQVLSNLPGFTVGAYRWRDSNTENAVAVAPTNWNIDPVDLGVEKFIAGIGGDTDLQPLEVEQVNDSIYLDVIAGQYFTGPERYYLPATPMLEFWGAHVGAQTNVLAATPTPQTPIFIGNWSLDSQGFYEKNVEYRYIAVTTEPDGSPRTDLPTYYFTLDRTTNTVVMNQALDTMTLFIGTLSGDSIDYFDMPVYPVDGIQQVYVDQGLGNTIIPSTNFAFDSDQGTLTITNPTPGSKPSIPGALAGQPVYAVCDAAVAVLYETAATTHTRQLSSVDLNPAFSGLSSGYVYLQHRRQKPDSIVLSCDKPRIEVPPTAANISGLIAFGPVYFDGDYALLSAQVYSRVPGEVVPNATLNVVPGSGWSGLINGVDPTSTTVSVITGGDGIAQMIYTPTKNFGSWLPITAAQLPVTTNSLGGVTTTTIANDTLVLAAPIPIDEIRTNQEGWLVTVYLVYNNNPLFGLVGADPNLGEIAWMTSGTPGGTDYKTNGVREAWRIGLNTIVTPISALDANGNNYNAPGFNGTVKQLVFNQALPSDPTIGAFFVTYVQRITLSLQAQRSNVKSNSILLEMATPEEIIESPWLIVNDDVNHVANEDVYGLINVYRLGWTKPVDRGV